MHGEEREAIHAALYLLSCSPRICFLRGTDELSWALFFIGFRL